MSAASDLIEKAEREAGCRVDSDGFDNSAMAVLFGALSRAMGKSNHRECDDFAAGTLIKHNISEEGQREQESKEMMANMLMAGVSPDTLGDLFGKK